MIVSSFGVYQPANGYVGGEQSADLPYSQRAIYARNNAALAAGEAKTAQRLNEAPEDSLPAIDRAFETASIGVDEFVAADMKARILEIDASAQTYVERALILRFQSAQALSKATADEAIKAQNLILASRGEPPITPSEERRLENRIYAIVKQRVAFLDAFANAMSSEAIKIKA
jgi:hypothetical protein